MHNSGPRSIENGYFIFTLMPSLHCKLDCPHCYLTREQRRDPYIMPLNKLETVCRKIRDYYDGMIREGKQVDIIGYWYGGEPTDMGLDYFVQSFNMMDRVFGQEINLDQTILSSLVSIKDGELDKWISLARERCGNKIQTSFDWTMRGKGYVRNWERKVRAFVDAGIDVSIIAVVNRDIIDFGAESVIDYLTDLRIRETSWLPFMLNDRNAKTGMFDRFSPTMNEYSDFMIRLTRYALDKESAPTIGQFCFVAGQRHQENKLSNISGQTLFLLPDGTFCMPDYHDGTWQEYLRNFGNILDKNESFETILSSPERRKWLRKQALRNMNAECQDCDLHDCCIMEFWKDNRDEDECFGASKFVRWSLEQPEAEIIGSSVRLY
ncbi:MAG: radical SAM protein [Methanobacteriota archaeon]|nr:MAG: radical SAM protein [Euryarchaeota archaeon]